MKLLLAIVGYATALASLFCGLHIGVVVGFAAIAYSIAPEPAGGGDL